MTTIAEQTFTAPSGAVSVSGGWKYSGKKGKGGGSSRAPVEADDSLHSTSYARLLFLMGEGEVEGLVNGTKSIRIDDTPLENDDGTLNFQGVTVDFRNGTQTQDYIPGFPAAESTTSIGVELKQSTPWVRSSTNTQLSAMRVTIAVNRLTSQNKENGDLGGARVDYAIDLSTDGSAFEEVILGSFDGKTTSTYARSHRVELPKSQTGWSVRVRRLTPDSTDSTLSNSTLIQSVTDVIDGKLRYPMWSLLGIQLDASQFSSIPTISAEIYGRRIRVPSNYDAITHSYSGVWDGTFKISWTDNPAWIYYDLCTHVRYGLGEFIPDAWIDKWSLYQIGQYCDESVPDGKGGTEPRFSCNLYLQVAADAYRVLQDLASVFRGITYWASGMAIPVADMPKDASYTYANSNVISGKFVYGGSNRKTRYTSALVSWSDPSDMGRQKVESVTDRDGTLRYGFQETNISAFGCTSQGQAQRVGQWTLLTSLMETETVTFGVGLDGAVAMPGQVIKIADEFRAGRKISGRISFKTYEYVNVNGVLVTVTGIPVTVAGDSAPSQSRIAVTIDREVTISAGDRFTVMLPSGKAETRVVASAYGKLINVTVAFSEIPESGAVWVVESDELAAQEFRVVSVADGEGMTYNITAIQHVRGKFDKIDHGTKIELPPISVVPPSVQPSPKNVVIDSFEVMAQGVSSTTARFSWDAAEYASEYEIQWKRNNSDWVAMTRTGTASVELENAYSGAYIARVRAISAIGAVSQWANSTLTNIDGIMQAPSPVTYLNAVGIVFGITVSWGLPAAPNIIERTEIWYSETNNRANAIKLGDYAYPQTSQTLLGLQANKRFYFWARVVDKNGTMSDYFPTSSSSGVAGTSSSDATAILDYLKGEITETQLAQSLLEKIEGGDGALVEVQAIKDALAAMYTIKTQLTVDGVPYMAGIGVGVENDDGVITSQILLAAQRLAVLNEEDGETVTPFVIQGGQTIINSAVIGDASIGSAKLADWLESTAVGQGGVPVLRLNFRTGEIQMNSPMSGGGRMTLNNQIIQVFDQNNTLRVRMGLW
jgi:predicted phage tail protein